MIRVLIVEDEAAINSLIALSLKKAGYACECALDGTQAAEKIQTETYDLILLDVMMPNMDGFTLAEEIREAEALEQSIQGVNGRDDDARSHRPIIVASSHSVQRLRADLDTISALDVFYGCGYAKSLRPIAV